MRLGDGLAALVKVHRLIKSIIPQEMGDLERAQSWSASQITVGTDLTQLSLRPELVKNQPRNQHLSLNGFMLSPQGFQTRSNQVEFLGDGTVSDQRNLMSRNTSISESLQGNAAEHPSGFLRNSENFETAEAPVNFDFLGGPQQLMRNQQLGVSQPRPRQQQGFNDMQLFQQPFMYKQFHDFQKQQHFQQLDQEANQQNSLVQVSAAGKQPSLDQMPALVNGGVHEGSNYMWPGEYIGGDASVPSSSQMYMTGNMNWIQRSMSPAVQTIPNGFAYSQDQGQAFRSMGFTPQQSDQSLYGAPISSARGAWNQYAHLQGLAQDGFDSLTKGGGNQAAFSSFQSDQSILFPNQVPTQDGASFSKQGFQEKNLFNQVPMQALNNGMPGNFSQANPFSRSMHVSELQGRQEQTGWAGNLQERTATQVGTTQGMANLNPTEGKHFYGTDDGMMDASFGRSGVLNAGGYLHGNQLEGADYINAFPSVQSGSWSALMQSAVAEASSSETGLQDDWSGLGFQKTELSSGGHPTVPNESGKQTTAWVDNNGLQTASASARSFTLFDDANVSPSGRQVSGYQQPSTKFAFDQGETVKTDASHESLKHSPKGAGHWLVRNSQQKPLSDGNLQGQRTLYQENSSGGTWGSRVYEQSHRSEHYDGVELNTPNLQASWPHQKMSSYDLIGQSCNKSDSRDIDERISQSGEVCHSENNNALRHAQSNDGKRIMHFNKDHGGGMWKADDNVANNSCHDLAGGLGIKSGADGPQGMNKLGFLQNLSTSKINEEMRQQILNNHPLEHGKHGFLDSSMHYRGNDHSGNYQGQPGQYLQILDSSMDKSGKHEKKQANYLQKVSSNTYLSGHSHPGQQTVGGDGMKENAWFSTNDSHPPTGANQKQDGRKSSGPRRFQFHPMGNLEADIQPADRTKHLTQLQGPYPPGARGIQNQDRQHFVGEKYEGHVTSNDAAIMEKGHLPNSHVNAKEMEGVPSRDNYSGYDSPVSASHDGSSDRGTVQTSQNMLELLHKVDRSKENEMITYLGSSGHRSLDIPAADALAAHLQRSSQSSASQGFGLRLAPPSQMQPLPDRALTSQAVNDINSRHHDPEVNLGSGKPGLSSPAIQVQNQHISNASGKETASQLNLSSGSQDDQKTNSESGSHLKQVCESQEQVEADQSSLGSSHGTSNRVLPFNLASSADVHAPIASVQSYSSAAVHLQPTNQNTSSGKPSGQQFHVSQPAISMGLSQQGTFPTAVQNTWTKVSGQQHLSAGPSNNALSNSFQSTHLSQRNLDAMPFASQKGDNQNLNKGANGPFEFVSNTAISLQSAFGEEKAPKDSSLHHIIPDRVNLAPQPASASHGQESMARHFTVANSGASVSANEQDLGIGKNAQGTSQREHVSLHKVSSSNHSNNFPHISKQSDSSHQNYSLLHQIQLMKGAESDPGRKGAKRLRSEEFGVDPQHNIAKTSQRATYGNSKYVRDPADDLNEATQRSSLPASESKMLCFSSEGKDVSLSSSSQPCAEELGSHDTSMFRGNSHQNNTGPPGIRVAPSAHGGAERPQINPQMAPSWFERYGTYKNGQILGISDGTGSSQALAKAVAQQHFFGKASDHSHSTEQVDALDAAQAASAWPSSSNPATTNQQLSSSHSLTPDGLNQTLVIGTQHNHKSVASESRPWRRQATEGSERLRRISTEALDWAKSTNRRIDKLEDEADTIDGGSPMPRPQIRLILTTQLMQQLLRAMPAAVLCADATAEYESVTYLAAKSALGDACSLVSYPRSDSHVHANNYNMVSEKLESIENVGDQCLQKVVENFIGRTKKVEDDLLRQAYVLLERGASILDIRVECQDLERFSTINRFARFHGRGNVDGAESSSSLEAMGRRPFAQRYVTAVAMPRNLPEGVLCLSL
ncbi:hypothetical protein ACLOJK_002453 [Asimina triloba]